MRHEKLKMPEGDVLIHCGDFTNHGSLSEVREFAAWLSTLPYKHIIVVPGNHGGYSEV
jgi:3',5'-cyclic AMP phosphodiesterase CpdA